MASYCGWVTTSMDTRVGEAGPWPAGSVAWPQLLQAHWCAGQELMWKGAGLGGSSEKCHGGVNSVSNVNRECQIWLLPLSDPLGLRKGENSACQHL